VDAASRNPDVIDSRPLRPYRDGAASLVRWRVYETIEPVAEPYLAVRISGREKPDRIALTDGDSVQDELARFLNRQGPYAQMWIRLASGEYVRYDAIESVALPS
jgi:hypothetical protein